MATELWMYPDGSRILELSTKCLPSKMFQVALRPALPDRDRHRPSGRQQTKTKAALEQFARHLPAAG